MSYMLHIYALYVIDRQGDSHKMSWRSCEMSGPSQLDSWMSFIVYSIIFTGTCWHAKGSIPEVCCPALPLLGHFLMLFTVDIDSAWPFCAQLISTKLSAIQSNNWLHQSVLIALSMLRISVIIDFKLTFITSVRQCNTDAPPYFLYIDRSFSEWCVLAWHSFMWDMVQ